MRRCPASAKLDSAVQKLHIGPIFLDPVGHLQERPLNLCPVIAEERTTQYRVGPCVQVSQLRRGDIKFAMKPGQEWFNPAAFFFQRRAAWNFKFKRQKSNDGGHGIILHQQCNHFGRITYI